jgi:hypothetical protein
VFRDRLLQRWLVGKFEGRNGVYDLIAAAGALPHVRFRMLGWGPDKDGSPQRACSSPLLLSVVIPTYRRPDRVRQAAFSIFKQDLRKDEYELTPCARGEPPFEFLQRSRAHSNSAWRLPSAVIRSPPQALGSASRQGVLKTGIIRLGCRRAAVHAATSVATPPTSIPHDTRSSTWGT